MLKKVYQQLVINSMNSIEQLVQAIEILTKRVDQQDILIKRLDRCCCPSSLKCNRHAVQYIDRQFSIMQIENANKEKKIKIMPQQEYADFTKDERRLVTLKAERDIEKEKKRKEEREKEKKFIDEREKERKMEEKNKKKEEQKNKKSESRSIYNSKQPPIPDAEDINSLFRLIQWNKEQEEEQKGYTPYNPTDEYDLQWNRRPEQKEYTPDKTETDEYDPDYPIYDGEITSMEGGGEEEGGEGSDYQEPIYESVSFVSDKTYSIETIEEKVDETIIEKVDEMESLRRDIRVEEKKESKAEESKAEESKADFTTLDTVKKLKEFCKQKGFKNYSRCKTKADFYKFIKNEEKEIRNVMEEVKEETVEEIDESKILSKDDWMKMHLSKLKEFCKKKGFKGHSKCKTKDDFVKFIMERL